MRTRFFRPGRLCVLAALASGGLAAPAAAQPPALADVAARVPLGEMLHVTDASGAITKGTLAIVNADAVQVRVGTTLRTVAASDIRRIQWEKRDSVWTGILIGAGIGAVPGIYWLIADPNECTGLCAEDYVAIGAGAAIGGLIDRAIRKRVTVYTAGAPGSRARAVTIRPFRDRGRRGVQFAVRF